jgi:RNAse (barnase) inhibitor barstar
MTAPDLTDLDAAGIVEYDGTGDALTQAASHARLRFSVVDLARIADKRSLMNALAKALKLPSYFGHNWDALADCLEDDGFLRKPGMALHLAQAAAFRDAHPGDWNTLEMLLGEAVEYWKERGIALWVIVS